MPVIVSFDGNIGSGNNKIDYVNTYLIHAVGPNYKSKNVNNDYWTNLIDLFVNIRNKINTIIPASIGDYIKYKLKLPLISAGAFRPKDLNLTTYFSYITLFMRYLLKFENNEFDKKIHVYLGLFDDGEKTAFNTFLVTEQQNNYNLLNQCINNDDITITNKYVGPENYSLYNSIINALFYNNVLFHFLVNKGIKLENLKLKTGGNNQSFISQVINSININKFDYTNDYYRNLYVHFSNNLNKSNNLKTKINLIKKSNKYNNIEKQLSSIILYILYLYENNNILSEKSITYLTHFETTIKNYNKNFIIKKHFKFILFSIIVKNGENYYSYVYKNKTWHKIDLLISPIITTGFTLDKIMNNEKNNQKTYIYINEDFLRSNFEIYDPYDKNIYTQSRDKLYNSYGTDFSLIISPIPSTPP